MEAFIILVMRLGVLAVLWLFIGASLLLLRKQTSVVAPAGRPARGSSHTPSLRYLEVMSGPAAGERFDLLGVESLTLGRNQGDIQLHDEYASTTHARLWRHDNDWLIEDLDSRNGTFVAGQKIENFEWLLSANGPAEIKIGRTIVRLTA